MQSVGLERRLVFNFTFTRAERNPVTQLTSDCKLILQFGPSDFQLSVRIIDPGGGGPTSKHLTDKYLQMMCRAETQTCCVGANFMTA